MPIKYLVGVLSLILCLVIVLPAADVGPKKSVSTSVCNTLPECDKALLYGSNEIKKQALAKMSKMKSRAVPSLIRAMSDSNSEVREGAIQALRRIGPDAKDAIPLMISMLKNTDKTEDDSEIRVLMYALPDFGAIAVPELVSAMAESNPIIRERIIWILNNMGSEAKAGLPVLHKAVSDINPDVRTAAMLAIGRIGPDAKAAIPMLIPLLKSEKEFVREFAATRLLDWVSPKTPEVVAPLIDILEDKSESGDQDSLRETIVEALGKVGPGAKAAIPVLTNMFYHKKVDNLVPKAIRALTQIGPEAASELVKILNDKTSPIRGVAAPALSAFGENYVPVLVAALKDPDSKVRGKVALSLGHIGPGAKAAVPELVEVLRSTVASINEEHNVRAAIALGDIGPNAKDAVPALIESLKDEGALRRFSVEALGKIGPAAIAAVPHLEALLKYSDESWSQDEIKKAVERIKRKVK